LNCSYPEDLSKEVSKLFDLKSNQKISNSKGCEQCSNTGYRGRIAIAECIQVDRELKEMIHNNSSENKIANYVFKDNQSIDQASLDLLINGITSADELIRVGNLKEDANI
jgi:type II secretory ATPase GspE/PulE/Tfp pilus assembly ATPase PilB-like protein